MNMGKKDILIVIGILVILLALAVTVSAKSGYGAAGANCSYCHDSTFSLIEKGITFKELHKFNGVTVPNNAAHCNECHIDITVFLPLTSRGENYSNSHRYNDTTLASERLAPPACFNCHIDVNAGNYTFITGISATYLTSLTCENCHKVKYDDWKGTMHRVMLTNNVTAQAMGLPTPSGFSWANISYVIVGKPELRYLNESGYLFKRYFSENQTFADYGPSQYTCGRCHTTGYSPAGNQSGLPGIVGTWSEPGIACEKCHGPGGNGHHVEANVSEQVCLQCHNGSTRQGTFLSSAHSPPLKAPVSCLRCHSPFDYARNRTVTSTTAINVVCANCHNSHNTSDNKYRELFSPGGFNQAVYENVSDAKNSFFNSSASRILLTGGVTGTLTTGKDVYDILITPALIPSDIIDESYPGPINVTGPISEVLCSNCHYEHGLSHIAGVNLTHARLNYPGLGLAPATCTDCHMSGDLKSHSFNVKDENNFPSRTCSRGTECHVTSDQNLNHSSYSVVPVVNEWKASAHNDKEIGVPNSSGVRNPNSSFYRSINGTTGIVTINSRQNSCLKCHSPMDWNPLTDSNTTDVQLPAGFNGITCGVCHNIHDMGDWLKKTNDTFGEAKFYAWYNRDAIPIYNTTGALTRYKANYSMMANTTELCGNCHSNIRIGNTGPGYGTPTSRNPTGIISPHGFPAKDVFMGSPKQTASFECIDCHMATKITDPTNLTEIVLPDSQKVKGHSFKVNVPLLQNATCKDCHAIGNISDRIEVIQAYTHTKWNATNITVMNALATINAFTGEKNQSRGLIAEAYWNLRMVSSDESWGVHNPNGTNKLLDDATALANDSLAKLGQAGILNTITVSPATTTLAINGTQIFNATALDQNGAPMSGITIVWASNNTTVGNVSPLTATTDVSGGATTTFTAGAAGIAMITANNSTVAGSANVTVTTAPVVAKIVISQITVVVGTTVIFSAQAFDQFNNPVNVILTWASSNTTVGTIDPTTGTFLAKANGITTINATNGLVVGSTNVVVISSPAAVLKTITVSPATTNLAVNGTQVFTATALDQNSIPIAGVNITWASNDTTVGNVTPATATTGAFGNVTTTFTANAEGIAMVTAMSDTVTGSANVTVSPAQPALKTITVSPPTATLIIGGTQVITATAKDQNGNPVQGINITWTSSNTAAGSVAPMNAITDVNGSAVTTFTASASGTAIVKATNGSFIASTTVTVTLPVVTSFMLTPETNVTLKGNNTGITITAMNGIVPQPFYNGIANITITANNTSAVNAPANVSFVNGNATININSGVAQFVTVTATNGTITGSTTVEFADFVIPLAKGWNLVSIPSFANPSDITLALQLVQNNGVQTFDPATMKFVTPTDLQPLFGYWINVTADNQKLGFIADTSVIIVPPTRNLYEGWNLIGVSANRNESVDMTANAAFVDLRNGELPSQWVYSRLVSFDGANPQTYIAGVDLTLDSPLKQGHGYWLFIKSIPNTNKNNVPWAGKLW